jgi:hypothetical protein
MRPTPFLDAFRQAVHPDFVPPALTGPQGQKPRLVPMLSAAELRKLASCYQCSVKTLRRLLHRGTDITDPEALASALAGQRNVSIPMLETVVFLAADKIKADLETTI